MPRVASINILAIRLTNPYTEKPQNTVKYYSWLHKATDTTRSSNTKYMSMLEVSFDTVLAQAMVSETYPQAAQESRVFTLTTARTKLDSTTTVTKSLRTAISERVLATNQS